MTGMFDPSPTIHPCHPNWGCASIPAEPSVARNGTTLESRVGTHVPRLGEPQTGTATRLPRALGLRPPLPGLAMRRRETVHRIVVRLRHDSLGVYYATKNHTGALNEAFQADAAGPYLARVLELTGVDVLGRWGAFITSGDWR